MIVMRTQGAIGHLDADCFYVSAERVRNFLLRENPVGVLGNQGACVIAKSYEMKATGVKTGIPIWEALKLCRNGLYVKRDFRWYEVLSKLMLECVREFSPKVEYYSRDEFFFEVVPFKGENASGDGGSDSGSDLGGSPRPGDRGHRQDENASQADLRFRQALRGIGSAG
jgi:nucleotidyltransferase/DNA polymerase involved in DNA repair